MHPVIGGIFGLGGPELLLILIILGFALAFAAIPAVLAYLVLNRIPPQFRRQSPGLAFLLLIPFFSLIWNFFVHPKVAESLKAYYDAHGAHSHGDCGGGLALWMCICCVGAFIPFLGFVAGIAGLVLLIMFYVKAFELSSRIPPLV
ncbi:MAG: hypothetical protein KF715_10145 [Candidatus Didemnitutus sp.]|nr:hypothetical protein [Candidatus Didemnitutus sp.]